MLDPRIALLLWIARRTGRAFRPDISVDALRAVYAETNARLGLRDRGGVVAENHAVPTPDGPIPARLSRPAAASGPLPLLLFFHGGGFCIGDVASYDHLARFFAREGRIAVLSIEYRLAPEFPFPQAHEDAFAALRWVQDDAAALGIDPARIAVGGDSAGGALAASLSAYAEARGMARPAYQLLIYPSVDRTRDFASLHRYTKNLMLTPDVIAWFTARFLPNSEDARDPRLALLDAPHQERLPPTYLLAAQYDPLVDEGKAYADRLRGAGVAVTYDLRPTLLHGFVNLAGPIPAARRALRDAIVATATALRARA